MILSLFIVLLVLSLVFIFIGIIKPDESAIALVGFVFLFLLSFIILNGQLQYETGANLTSYGNNTYIVYTHDFYTGTTAHQMGYYMVIISVVGFVGVLLGLRSAWKKEKERRAKEQ